MFGAFKFGQGQFAEPEPITSQTITGSGDMTQSPPTCSGQGGTPFAQWIEHPPREPGALSHLHTVKRWEEWFKEKYSNSVSGQGDCSQSPAQCEGYGQVSVRGSGDTNLAQEPSIRGKARIVCRGSGRIVLSRLKCTAQGSAMPNDREAEELLTLFALSE